MNGRGGSNGFKGQIAYKRERGKFANAFLMLRRFYIGAKLLFAPPFTVRV